MRYAEHVMDLVGQTPLVKLNKVTEGLRALVLAKVEYFNPGGSVKDRIALRMVRGGRGQWRAPTGGTIVEPTSGNTGIRLAMLAQRRGYKCVFVCPDKVSEDKRNVLRAYGAEVVVCPTAVARSTRTRTTTPRTGWPRDPRRVEAEPVHQPEQPGQPLRDDRPRAVGADRGPDHPLRRRDRNRGHHQRHGRYLKEVSDGRVRVIGADPEGSVYSGGSGRPYLVEGVGEDFWPTTYDRDICDEILAVRDADSFHMTRRLAREEALLVGGSCGMAAAAALRVAASLTGPEADDAMVVVLLPDGGRGTWRRCSTTPGCPPTASSRRSRTRPPWVTCCAARTAGCPSWCTATRTRRWPTWPGTARIRRVPAADRGRRAAGDGRRGGRRGERTGPAGRTVHREAQLADRVERHMSAPLPTIGAGEPVNAAMKALAAGDGALVERSTGVSRCPTPTSPCPPRTSRRRRRADMSRWSPVRSATRNSVSWRTSRSEVTPWRPPSSAAMHSANAVRVGLRRARVLVAAPGCRPRRPGRTSTWRIGGDDRSVSGRGSAGMD